ncbi:MAG: hypothetical protein AB7I18_10360 [Candidatus Berkiella sp.]
MAAGGMRRLGAKMFETAASAARSPAMKRMGNEVGEWAAGQVIGQVINPVLDPNGNSSKLGYMKTASKGKLGSALFNFAADSLVDSLKSGPKAAAPTSAHCAEMHHTLLTSPMPSAPETSLRDRLFQMSSTGFGISMAQHTAMMQHTEPEFNVTSLLDQGFSGQKSFLQMFKKNAGITEENDAKVEVSQKAQVDAGADVEADHSADADAAQVSEQVSPSRNKI